MKTIIVYHSKTGFTKKYAEWIAKELDCEIVNLKQFKSSSLATYDHVIFGSYVHAGKIHGLKKFKSLFSPDQLSKLIIFATGATPLETTETIMTMWQSNLSEQEKKTIKHFYFPGGLNYDLMGPIDRFIMTLLAKMLSKQKEKNAIDSGVQLAIATSHDISSKAYIIPLIQELKQ